MITVTNIEIFYDHFAHYENVDVIAVYSFHDWQLCQEGQKKVNARTLPLTVARNKTRSIWNKTLEI